MSAAEPITFLTWNLCMMVSSQEAPAGWSQEHAEAKVRELVLQLDPDFVCFQELPGLVPYVETHDLLPANTESHSGNIATLVRNEMKDEVQATAIGRFAVTAKIESRNITLANVHLAPSQEGADKRIRMLQTLIQRCETPGLVVVGDTNTRVAEEEKIEKIGLVGERPPRATWDTKANLFRAGGGKFTAYFTRYFHNREVVVDEVEVWDDKVEHNETQFHLSDHFPLSGSARLGVG